MHGTTTQPNSTRLQVIAPFSPLPWQIAPWQDKSPILLLTGSVGGGKSRLAAEKLHAYMLKYPGATGLMTRKIKMSMASGTILFLRRKIIGNDPSVRFIDSPKLRFEYRNGSVLSFVGLQDEDARENLKSIGQDGAVDIAVMEEGTQFDEEDLNAMIARMRGKAAPWRQIIIPTNPGSEDHWMKRRLIDGGQSRIYYSSARDNFHNPDDYAAWLATLTGIDYQRLVLGRWVGVEGPYFTQLDEALHLVEYEHLPYGWPAWAALDYGFVHPLAFGVFTCDPQGRIILLGAHHEHHWYVKQHAKAMDELLALLNVPKAGLRIVAGHDCWAKGHDDPETIADKFAQHGYRLGPANTARVIGARALGERLGNPAAGVPVTKFYNRRYGARAVFNALARMKHDPHNPEDVLKVNADAEGRGGDDDYDMDRYGTLAAPTSGWNAAALGALSSGRRV